MLIAFEGIDGCGKTTQAKMLVDRLQSMGYTAYYIREPGHTVVGERIRDILLNCEVYPWAEAFLFSAARVHFVRDVLRPALLKYDFVITDRYYLSTIAYQGYGRGLDGDLLQRIISQTIGDILPDRVILLDVPIDLAQQRCVQSNRLDMQELQFYQRVLHGYAQLRQQEQWYWCIDNGNRSIRQIHEEIVEWVINKNS